MKITISKEFDSIDEAQAFLDQFSAPEGAVERAADAIIDNVQTAPKRRGRPRKAASVPQQEPSSAAPEVAGNATEPAATPAPVVTASAIEPPAPAVVPEAPAGQPGTTPGVVGRDDAMKALRGLFNTKGEAATTELLQSFGAASFGQIPAEKYGDLVAAVNAKLA